MTTREALGGPGWGLVLSGAGGTMLHCCGWAFSIFGIVVGLQGRGRDEDYIPMFIALFLVTIVGMLAGIFIAIGGNALRNASSYGLARAAAIVAVIPCLHPLGMLGMPFGIWALMSLGGDARSHFSS